MLCVFISLSDPIERFFSLPLLSFATASLSKIAVFSPLNGNIIILWLLSMVWLGIDCILILSWSWFFIVRVHWPVMFFESIVTVFLSILIVKSMFWGVSVLSDRKISTYPLLVLYAMSRPFSMIKFFSCRESTLAVKKSGFLEIKNNPNAIKAAPIMMMVFPFIIENTLFLFIFFQIDKMPNYLFFINMSMFLRIKINYKYLYSLYLPSL